MVYNHTTGDGDRIFAPVFADVWDTHLKKMNGSDVKVYVALLLHTTQHDRTWFMSIDELSEDSGVSRDTARLSKDRLVEAGLFEQSWRYRDEAGDYHLTDTRPPPRMQAKNVYTVKVKATSVDAENQSDEVSRGRKSAPIEADNKHLVEADNQQQTRTPTTQPPTEPLSPLTPKGADGASTAEVDPAMARFQEFYDTYGRKKKRPDAERAWKKAVKKADPHMIIDAAAHFVAAQKAIGKHPQYTPYPASWLNSESWNDEIDTASQSMPTNSFNDPFGGWLPPTQTNAPELPPSGDLFNANFIEHQESY